MDLPELPELCRDFPIYRPWEKGPETPKYLYLMENYCNYRDYDFETEGRSNIYYEWKVLTDQKQFITNLYQYIIAEELFQNNDYCNSNSSNNIRLTLIPINEQLNRTLTTKIRKHIYPFHSYKKDNPYIHGIRFEFNLEFMNGVLNYQNDNYLREPNLHFNKEQSEAIRLMYLEDELLQPKKKLILTEYIKEFQEFRKICFYHKLESLPWVNSRPPSHSFSQSPISLELRSSMVHSILKPKYVQLDLSKLTPINVIHVPDVRNYYDIDSTDSSRLRENNFIQTIGGDKDYHCFNNISKMKCSKRIDMTVKIPNLYSNRFRTSIGTISYSNAVRGGRPLPLYHVKHMSSARSYRWCCLDSFDNFDQKTIWDDQAHIENAIKLSRHIQNYYNTN
tara:strand:- start:1428 stop:2603 length:1176 start_codon:yes stop_codon:yes gene_type:complete